MAGRFGSREALLLLLCPAGGAAANASATETVQITPARKVRGRRRVTHKQIKSIVPDYRSCQRHDDTRRFQDAAFDVAVVSAVSAEMLRRFIQNTCFSRKVKTSFILTTDAKCRTNWSKVQREPASVSCLTGSGPKRSKPFQTSCGKPTLASCRRGLRCYGDGVNGTLEGRRSRSELKSVLQPEEPQPRRSC